MLIYSTITGRTPNEFSTEPQLVNTALLLIPTIYASSYIRRYGPARKILNAVHAKCPQDRYRLHSVTNAVRHYLQPQQ